MATRESICKGVELQRKIDELEEFIRLLKNYRYSLDTTKKTVLKVKTKRSYSILGSAYLALLGQREKEINIPKEMFDFLLASAIDLKINYEKRLREI